MNLRTGIAAVLAVTAGLAFPWVMAHDVGAGEEKVSPLQLQKLPDVPGKQAIMALVSYEPGQASPPHFHSGSVFAYVIEGEVVSQIGHQAPVTYRAGESWYEPPGKAHLVSRNASATRPAKLVAWLLMDEGGKVKQALPK